jgi:hypothetical protein
MQVIKGDKMSTGIQPFEENRFYWALNGEPIVLLGLGFNSQVQFLV